MTATIDLDYLERKAREIFIGWWNRIYDAPSPRVTIALIDRIRTAERERDEAIAKLPNWSHAEALQQRDAMIAANVAAQAELRGLRAERDALLPIVEAVAGASADQPIGSVRVFTVGDGITSRWLPIAAAEALRASKEGK